MDLRIFTEPQQGASHSDLLAVAQATRAGGFSAFFRSDHLLSMGDGSGLPGPSESFVNLGAIAAQVPDIRVGTMVTSATFRHPSMTAIAAAQIDDISGGRMELGLGSGWYAAEHAAYGIDFGASFGERFDRLTEQLEIITGLWATPIGSTFDHVGAHYTLSGAPGLPKPVQRDGQGTPRVPIIIGGHGPKKTPALAARFADEFNIGFTDLDASTSQLGRVRAACEAISRDPASLVYSVAHPLCVGGTEAEFERRARAIGREPAEIREASPFAGTVAEVVDTMGIWAAAGVQRGYLQVMDLADLGSHRAGRRRDSAGAAGRIAPPEANTARKPTVGGGDSDCLTNEHPGCRHGWSPAMDRSAALRVLLPSPVRGPISPPFQRARSRRRPIRHNETGLVGQDDRLHPVAQTELAQHPPDMGLDRAVLDDQLAGNFLVGGSGGKQVQNLFGAAAVLICRRKPRLAVALLTVALVSVPPADRTHRLADSTRADLISLAPLIAASVVYCVRRNPDAAALPALVHRIGRHQLEGTGGDAVYLLLGASSCSPARNVDPDDLPDAAAVAAHRLVQEAITNAFRHAPGASITVDLSGTGPVSLTVTNGPAPTRFPDPPPHSDSITNTHFDYPPLARSGAGRGLIGL